MCTWEQWEDDSFNINRHAFRVLVWSLRVSSYTVCSMNAINESRLCTPETKSLDNPLLLGNLLYSGVRSVCSFKWVQVAVNVSASLKGVAVSLFFWFQTDVGQTCTFRNLSNEIELKDGVSFISFLFVSSGVVIWHSRVLYLATTASWTSQTLAADENCHLFDIQMKYTLPKIMRVRPTRICFNMPATCLAIEYTWCLR